MSRSRSGFYSTIEYIGPRPQKPKRQNFFGGWVIVAIAVGMGFWFGRPLIPFLKAAQVGASTEQATILISSLEQSKDFGSKLAAAALFHSSDPVTYDPSYYKIAYPNGDVPATKVAVIRYTGFWSDANYSEHLSELESALTAAGLNASGPPVYSRYDPPWTLWFMRRNEIWLPLDHP